MDSPPKALGTLIERFDETVFDGPPEGARIRLDVREVGAWDAVINGKPAFLEKANGHEPDAILSADQSDWTRISRDTRNGMKAFQDGRFMVRRNMHLGVNWLAATSGTKADPARLTFETVRTRSGRISTVQAGQGDPVICIHGLGASKASFLTTVAALADRHRVIAMDLPGFGDSGKPFGAPYDAEFFARSVIDLMDRLRIRRAHLVGNSMGGRVSLEVAMQDPSRVGRTVLLAPALAWLRNRPWAPLLKLVRPELGVIQPTPKLLIDPFVRRLVPGANDGWAAAGVDEFLRAFHTPRGRAAFYAAARNIYLDAPNGDEGFWRRLHDLQPDSMFVWGHQDTLVPIGFMRHVQATLPEAEHLELDCGHVPQVEMPNEVHRKMRSFFGRHPLS